MWTRIQCVIAAVLAVMFHVAPRAEAQSWLTLGAVTYPDVVALDVDFPAINDVVYWDVSDVARSATNSSVTNWDNNGNLYVDKWEFMAFELVMNDDSHPLHQLAEEVWATNLAQMDIDVGDAFDSLGAQKAAAYKMGFAILMCLGDSGSISQVEDWLASKTAAAARFQNSYYVQELYDMRGLGNFGTDLDAEIFSNIDGGSVDDQTEARNIRFSFSCAGDRTRENFLAAVVDDTDGGTCVADSETPGAGSLDSDGDGLTDDFEDVIGTEEDDPDSDNDGLSDYDEVYFDGDGAYEPYHAIDSPSGTDTDANNPDTDGDGVSDGLEVAFGYNPLSSGSTPELPLGLPAVLLVVIGAVGVSVSRRLGGRQ